MKITMWIVTCKSGAQYVVGAKNAQDARLKTFKMKEGEEIPEFSMPVINEFMRIA